MPTTPRTLATKAQRIGKAGKIYPSPRPKSKPGFPRLPYQRILYQDRPDTPKSLIHYTRGGTFALGQKKIYLPNFDVTLQYNPLVPPTHAQFQVPLTFNKFDLRDYLYHAYNVRILSIRSQVVLQPIRMVESGSYRDIPGKKSAYRPQSKKRMIVQLEKPFVWPPPLKEKARRIYSPDAYKGLKAESEYRLSVLGQRRKRDDEHDLNKDVRIYNAKVERANMLTDGKLQWKSDLPFGASRKEQLAAQAKPDPKTEVALNMAKLERRRKMMAKDGVVPLGQKTPVKTAGRKMPDSAV